jgi:hypothetical protein
VGHRLYGKIELFPCRGDVREKTLVDIKHRQAASERMAGRQRLPQQASGHPNQVIVPQDEDVFALQCTLSVHRQGPPQGGLGSAMGLVEGRIHGRVGSMDLGQLGQQIGPAGFLNDNPPAMTLGAERIHLCDQPERIPSKGLPRITKNAALGSTLYQAGALQFPSHGGRHRDRPR